MDYFERWGRTILLGLAIMLPVCIIANLLQCVPRTPQRDSLLPTTPNPSTILTEAQPSNTGVLSMASVFGPLMSMDASGSLAKAIVFSKWKGRNYVRQLVTPKNPKSNSQVGVRSMFKFLAQQWAGLGAADQATWEDRADQTIISPFNAYMAFNQSRWRDFNTPSHEDPPDEAGTLPTGPTGTATPDGRAMIIEITDGVNPPDWGYCLFRSITGTFTLAWSNCIAVIPWDSGGVTDYVDSPLEPDQYYYNAIGFLDSGLEGADGTEWDGTIT